MDFGANIVGVGALADPAALGDVYAEDQPEMRRLYEQA